MKTCIFKGVFRDFLGNYTRDFGHSASECRRQECGADAKNRRSIHFVVFEIFEVKVAKIGLGDFLDDPAQNASIRKVKQ